MLSRGTARKQCDKIDYVIRGHDLQVIEVELDPGETVVAEPGAALFFDDDVSFSTFLGDGSRQGFGFLGSLWSAAKRRFVGESLAMTHFTNHATGDVKRKVWFSAPYPGHVIPINLAELGCNLLCAREAFICAARGTQLTVGFQTNLGAAFFGGVGFIMQKLIGDGMVFVHGGGAIIKRELEAGQSVFAEAGSVVALSETIRFEVRASGGLRTMVFGGEGVLLAQLTGPGTVWIQSLPFPKLCERVYSHIQPKVQELLSKQINEVKAGQEEKGFDGQRSKL